ncbi:methyltransferase small [[Clostridium] cellulosi]|jgi:Methyltransferase small domain.|uniref:Methyltransferase small n=1 Tax=[Clostridium] cellulosi TaxID=29343 RepID=A0A078KNE4_9FIRM|nr:methyltransferase small [[Clostridium] cellulosi]
MPQFEPLEEKIEPLGGGFFAVTSKNHTFGTDAILLSDFAAPKAAKRLCDLCSGCGIIAVLWACEGGARQIDAVEIQSDAVRLIEKSAEINGFSNIHPINADLRALDSSYNDCYNLVACNPPYKQAGTGGISRSTSARIARHELACTLGDIIETSSRILKGGGRLCLCHRPERLADIICLMREKGIEPKRLRFVQQRVDTKPWLVLVEGKKGAKPGLLAEPALIVESDDGGYSSEMSAIYNKFQHE